jgi:hypothetical protein
MTIKGLDDHITSQPEQPDPKHWHVSRHRDDDDVFITEDFWTALDYAATELRDLAEFEYEGISASGDAGDYEGAYKAFVRSNELDALRNNLAHAIDQHNKIDPDDDIPGTVNDGYRAPLYRGYGGDERIMETALRAVESVNLGSDMAIWECTSELVYLNDTATRESDPDNGQPYHLDEWESVSRFTRGPEPAAMTDR